MMFRRGIISTGLALGVVVLLAAGSALGLGKKPPIQEAVLDEQTIAAGLKEALRIATERTVESTSKLDGFLGNALIRIVLPEQFETAAKTLRAVGLGDQVDELEVGMNRAAERAAGEATDVFLNAISQMTLKDATGILKGGDNAVTDYFRTHTEDSLRERFKPIVTEKMSEVGLYNIYNGLTEYYNKIPLVTSPALDLDEYVTQHALDGMFTILGQEEKRIRTDPVARTTELLRRVFGSL